MICVAAKVGRVGRECCLDWGLSELLFARCQVSKGWSATGELWDLGGWAVICVVRCWAWGWRCCLD